MSLAVVHPIEPAKSLQPAHAPAPVGKAALGTGREPHADLRGQGRLW